MTLLERLEKGFKSCKVTNRYGDTMVYSICEELDDNNDKRTMVYIEARTYSGRMWFHFKQEYRDKLSDIILNIIRCGGADIDGHKYELNVREV